ncbi:MAG: ABC transporter permease [Bacteroidales bacterium]|jgi:molybdate/tungstate transport system permease protein|nr:ABC transporter permease [Bacteroidales bacterium]
MYKTRLRTFDIILLFLGGLILLFIISPLLGMFLATTPTQLFETSRDPEVVDSIWLTLRVSLLATLFFALGAVPLSYFLARTDFKLKKIINGIIDLPIVIPHSAAGIAILGFISRDSVLGKIGSALGLNFVGHPSGIALAMAFVSIPFLINAARDGFENVPVRLEKTALNLGASPVRVFFTISLPLAWKNILSGLIMMFARGLSEFGAVVIVAYHPMITPVLIYERFGAFGLKYARPVSVVFIVVCLVFFVLLRILATRKKTDNA